MTRWKPILGLLVGAALCCAAFGAQNAAALTAHECVNVKPKQTTTQYTDSTCSKPGNGGWYTEELPEGIYLFKVTQTSTLSLTAEFFGVGVHVGCTGVSGEGEEGNEEVEGVKTVHGSETIDFTGCTPEIKGCEIPGGKIESHRLTSKTSEEGEGNFMEYRPAEGETLASIVFEGCEAGALNGSHPLTGTLRGEIESDNKSISLTETSGSQVEFLGESASLQVKVHDATLGGGKTIAYERP